MTRLYFAVPAAMALLALLDMPDGYYLLLRVVIAVCAGLLAVHAHDRGSYLAMFAFGLLALIYNPIAPTRLEPEILAWVSIGTAAIFLVALAVAEVRDRRSRIKVAPSAASEPRRLG